MEKLLDDLYRTKFENPFNNLVTTCAYLLKRDEGNFLVYSSGKIVEEFDEIKKLGGISRQFLGHHHEASAFCDLVNQQFNAPLTAHAYEKENILKHCKLDETFEDSCEFASDFSSIYTPGHTKGSTCFVWKLKSEMILFSSDFLFLRNGQWAVSNDPGTEMQKIDSLERLKTISPSLVVPGLWIGEESYKRVNQKSWQESLDTCIEKIKQSIN